MTVSLSHNADADIAEKPITEYRFFQELISKPFVEAVYLFGSRARGDNREKSDYDLGAVCGDANENEWKSLEKLVRNNEELLVKVDIIRLEQKTEQPFLCGIIRDRKLLYLRENANHFSRTIPEMLQFIRSWDKKMLGWSIDLENITKDNPTPDDDLLKKSFLSFQYAFDAAWVLYRKCLFMHGMHTNTPLTTFREAYMEGWLTDRGVWEMMIADYRDTRNESVLEPRREVYKRFDQYIRAFRSASQNLKTLTAPYAHIASAPPRKT
jgi:predicted nucleotidyltransferase